MKRYEWMGQSHIAPLYAIGTAQPAPGCDDQSSPEYGCWLFQTRHMDSPEYVDPADLRPYEPHKLCGWSQPGWYNGECGHVATRVAVQPCENTVSGEFISGRCDQHGPQVTHGENRRIIRWEPVGDQYNEWR